MRLLQLATGPGELIDLHPNVTIVTGLDPAGRDLLIDAVVGLAAGRASSQPGLLEAHGVLFDLAPEALALLDIATGAIDPIVTAEHLPTPRPEPVRGPADDDGAAAAHDPRPQDAVARDVAAQAALVAAAEARLLAQAALDAAPDEAPTADDELTTRVGEAAEHRRRLAEQLAAAAVERAQADAARREVEAATAEVRERRRAAAVLSAAVAARLDAARQAGDDAGAREALDAAVAALAEVEAEVEAERAAEGPAAAEIAGEPPLERLARLEGEIEGLERRLAALGPADVDRVARAVEPLRSSNGGPTAPVPAAMALAEELSALDAALTATEASGGVPGAGLAEGRARLDNARQALLEAEQAVRRPELDRDAVERLEVAHADLLAAIDKANGVFGGARAQRRVEARRAAEAEILDELHLASYSDYMMGSSLLYVDPVREAALDAARLELAAAEDAWKELSTETETQLARAQQQERRRALLDQARELVGHPVPAGAAVEELRALRMEAEPLAELRAELRSALIDAGVALGGEALSADDLLLVADTWLTEARDAAERERAQRADLDRLRAERDASAAVTGLWAADGAGSGEPRAEERRAERLATARARRAEAEERHRAHLVAAQEAATLAEELALAAEAERVAAQEAAEADERVADAVRRHEEAAAAEGRLEAELDASVRAEDEATAALARRASRAASERDALVAGVVTAEAAHAAASAAAAATASERAALTAERAAVAEDASRVAAPAPEAPAAGAVSEAVEWYLLARLAAQRSVSLGGSVPLLLDDALAGLDRVDVEHVLGRLERMTDAVQVIVLSEDPVAASWAALAGADRAAVVRPQAASTV
jgi:hypothetical protein